MRTSNVSIYKYRATYKTPESKIVWMKLLESSFIYRSPCRIIQHILESRSETATIAMVNVKMDSTISKLINYADQLPLTQQAISIKIKLCQLLQIVSHSLYYKIFSYFMHTCMYVYTYIHTHMHARTCARAHTQDTHTQTLTHI